MNVNIVSVINSNKYAFTSSNGLVAGKEYKVRVRANNFITEYYSTSSDWSAISTFYSSILPKTVTDLTYSSLTKTGTVLSWSLLTAAED